MTRNALITETGKRDGNDGTWAKIKYDRRIVAIAKVEGAHTIYSDDMGVHRLARRVGITVIRIADLPLPPEDPQQELNFENSVDNDGQNTTNDTGK